jgi:hypothetical protein
VPFKLQSNNNYVLRSSVTLELCSQYLLGRCSGQLRKRYAGANIVYFRAERVYILEHRFASKSFAAIREAFSNVFIMTKEY